MSQLFAEMDTINKEGALPSEKTVVIERMTRLLRVVSKTKDPKSHKIFRSDEHFQKLKIKSKYLIENSLDRDLHERIISYLGSVGIETTEEERPKIADYFRRRDIEKRRDTFDSYAQNGLLTLKSAIERGD